LIRIVVKSRKLQALGKPSAFFMVKIVVKRTNELITTVTVCENPTPGSWGDYQLLLHQYRCLEKKDHWDQLWFNYRFLKDKELDYGPLWCVYCGKEDLRVYRFDEKQNYANMATADHFIPKSKAPLLARSRKNLRVACWHCNNKKAAQEWKEKFPYD